MRIPIEIETHDRRLGFDIAGSGNSLTAGMTVVAPGGAEVEYCGSYVRKAFGIPELLHLAVDVSKDVDVALFAAWLYDKIKGKPVERAIINRRVITEITEEGIRQVLEEEIRSDI